MSYTNKCARTILWFDHQNNFVRLNLVCVNAVDASDWWFSALWPIIIFFCLISDAAPFQHKLLLPFLLQLLHLYLTSVFFCVFCLCRSFLLYLIHTYIHIQIVIAFEFTVFDLECLHAVQNTNAIGSRATQCVSNCCCCFFFFLHFYRWT